MDIPFLFILLNFLHWKFALASRATDSALFSISYNEKNLQSSDILCSIYTPIRMGYMPFSDPFSFFKSKSPELSFHYYGLTTSPILYAQTCSPYQTWPCLREHGPAGHFLSFLTRTRFHFPFKGLTEFCPGVIPLEKTFLAQPT